jgi:hypothetical protein
MKIIPTQRGFGRSEFKDAMDVPCSIQESSLDDGKGPYIWLGAEHGLHFGEDNMPMKPPLPFQCTARMHLSQQHARELLPLLTFFAETGDLPKSDEDQQKLSISNEDLLQNAAAIFEIVMADGAASNTGFKSTVVAWLAAYKEKRP